MRKWGKTKRIGSVLLASVMLILAGCGEPNSSGTQSVNGDGDETYKIGAVLDITGGAAVMGVAERNTLQILVDDLNAKGGINGHKVELIVYDNGSNETKAVLAAKKLVEDDKVVAILGPSQSSTSFAVADSVEKAGVPTITMGSSPKIVEGKKYVFKTPPSDEILAKPLFDYIKTQGWKRIGLATPNSAFGDSGRSAWHKLVEGTDIQIVGDVRFPNDTKDASVELTKLMESKPDVVVVWAIMPAAAIVAKNYADLGYKGKVPYLGNSTLADPEFVTLAGPASEGIIHVSNKVVIAEQLLENDPLKPIIVPFVNTYEQKYGVRNQACANATDAFWLIVDALEKAGSPDRNKVRDELEKSTGVIGALGPYKMSPTDHNGLDGSGLVLVQIEQGKWKLLNK